jgi:hypothetical protein
MRTIRRSSASIRRLRAEGAEGTEDAETFLTMSPW